MNDLTSMFKAELPPSPSTGPRSTPSRWRSMRASASFSPNSARPQTSTARSSPEVVPGRSVRGWTLTNSSHQRSRTIPTGPR